MKKGLVLFFLLFCVPLVLWADQKDWEKFLSQKMSWADARHLLSRAAFGGTPKEIEALTGLTYGEVVKKMIGEMKTAPSSPVPFWIDEAPVNQRELRQKLQSLPEEERKEMIRLIRRMQNERQWELKGWWIQEMCTTPTPLTEKMTLFWHNHFTSSLQKCRSTRLMHNQIQLYRKFAKGNFKSFVKAVTKDPAMAIYLDSQTNRKGKPNENFGRELMELFTLGEGHYTEADIKQAARAFTGYTINQAMGKFHFRPRLHDWGKKTFMGQEGYFEGDDIVDIIFQKEQVSLYITQKLWKEFISPTPNSEEVRRLAEIFRKNNYDVAPLLEALFTSPHFWDSKNRGTLIKSPVELIVGTVRLFGSPVKKNEILARACAQLGQNVLDPPNVKGWEGGGRWITTTTLLLRRQVLMNVVRGVQLKGNNKKFKKLKGKQKEKMMAKMMMRKKMMAKKMMEQLGMDSIPENQRSEKLKNILLPIGPVLPSEGEMDLMELVEHYLLDIAYQLK